MQRVVCALSLMSCVLAACGDDDGSVCLRALDKWNACMDAMEDQTKTLETAWYGKCNDEAHFQTGYPEGGYIVALKSWSEVYLRCDPDPTTCLCSGQDFFIPEVYPFPE